ncbi:MAG: C25 family cysteine peptidase [Pyrinomonadaceae bacterium]
MTTDAAGNAAFTYTVAATVAAGQYVSATATDPAGRTSEFSGARNVIVATLARLVEFSAVEQDGVTRLDWATGYEVDNLGFNLYRESGGRRARLNASLIAGSALVAGPGVALTAGNSYAWADAGAGSDAAYWLEEIDLAGRSKTYGPFHPSRGAGGALRRAAKGVRSPLISQLSDGGSTAGEAQHQVSASDAARAKKLTRASGADAAESAREKQRWLASQAALKISVRAGGWYKVTRDELIAAGLSHAADPRRLQLYAGGVEVPMSVDAGAWLTPEGGVEFYGEGLDVPSTDTRVYWLVEGDRRGLRTGVRRASSSAGKRAADPAAAEAVTVVPVGPPSTLYFNYTAERRERTVYFSALQNGEAENFFGRVVNTGAVAQTLAARSVYPLDAQTATLEVSVQGVSLGRHHVNVTLNGVTLGALDFAGQTKSAAVFPVDSHLLREGDNQVQLVSAAPGDVSLTDYLRLNYLHAMRADGDRLRFGAPAGVVGVGGFTTPDVRVFDVTDPYAPEELPTAGAVTPDPRGGWGVRVGVAGAGTRELLALTGARVSRPASVAPNTPSRWSVDAGQRADMVVITREEFAEQVAPLVAARASEGMEVRVVFVEDIFDEFAYGAHTPQAVRDFLAWTRANWERPPGYVLLVGDGSYDPRDYLGRGRFDLVPSKLLDAGAMETASDDWFADFDDDGVADLAVGRLPVRTRAEAATVVGKILTRTREESEPAALLVADRDGADGYSFESATDGLRSLLPAGTRVARVNRRGQDAGVLRAQIVAGVNAGPLVVNWMGHGSVDVWTGEGLLRGADAPALTNGSRLPLFVMMTCLNGYYEGTGLDSLAESVLKAEGGGAYAVWASTGMTEPFAQAAANRELYRIIFSEGDVRLGDAVRRAKHATADRDVRRTWVFFGDPSSRLR